MCGSYPLDFIRRVSCVDLMLGLMLYLDSAVLLVHSGGRLFL